MIFTLLLKYLYINLKFNHVSIKYIKFSKDMWKYLIKIFNNIA